MTTFLTSQPADERLYLDSHSTHVVTHSRGGSGAASSIPMPFPVRTARRSSDRCSALRDAGRGVRTSERCAARQHHHHSPNIYTDVAEDVFSAAPAHGSALGGTSRTMACLVGL